LNPRQQFAIESAICFALTVLSASPAHCQVLKEKGKNAVINAIGHRNIAKAQNFYSMDKEKDLRKQLSREVESTAKVISDPAINAYLDRITQNLAHNSDSRFPIGVHLIRSDLPQGFALPGGYIYLGSGLILRAKNESQLAGAIAHLIAHVALREATAEATRGDIMQLASVPAMIFLPNSWAGYGTYEGQKLAIPLSLLKSKREEELEADYFGLQYLYKAGYDPAPYVHFDQEILEEAQAKQHVPENLSAVPDPSRRVAAMQEETAKILPARQSAVVNTSDFDVAKKHLAEILQSAQVQPSGENKPTLKRPSDAPSGP
jgi:predicted Zn-dependent protease